MSKRDVPWFINVSFSPTAAAHDWLSNVSFKSHLVERVEDSFAATEHHRESREITGKRIHSTSKELHDIAKKKPKYKTSRPKDVDGSSSTTVPTGTHAHVKNVTDLIDCTFVTELWYCACIQCPSLSLTRQTSLVGGDWFETGSCLLL